MDAYKLKRLGTGVAKQTIDEELSLLRHLFTKAVEWKKHNEKPVTSKMFLREEGRPGHALRRHEEARLIEAAPSHLREFIIFSLSTGFRRGQILSLKWTEADLIKRRLFLPVSRNKGKKDVYPPLSQTAARVLRSLPTEGEYCFGGVGDKARVCNAFKEALKVAGLAESIRIHDMRHTLVTRLGERERSSFLVQLLALHTRVKIPDKYVHPSEQATADALDRLEAGKANVTGWHEKG